jgi:2',3'-cyclic-nucleotide 2'-phosphodiesterase (5'-nucleotidase family)
MLLTLIHTNDMHGRLLPPAAARLASLLAEHPGAVYLDAGDAVSAGNLGCRLSGEPILREMTRLGCRAMALGNRETHPRKEFFPKKIADAGFPVLCANLRARDGLPLPTVPHVVLAAGPVTLGVFGLCLPMFTRDQWSAPLCDYYFADPLEAAREELLLLRGQVDMLCALTHLGYRRDLELAAACPGLDVIIGGHSHTELEAPDNSRGVPVLQARSHAMLCGIATLEPGRGLVAWETRPLREG